MAGFLLTQLGHIPAVGESVDFEGRRYTVVEMSGHRISRVRIEPVRSEAPAASATARPARGGAARRVHVRHSRGEHRHRSLVPAMSTLVIIAHVKDGADLARQAKIPEPIIDFIQQHHGTRLIGHFYLRAKEEAERRGAPLPGEAEFRYPGPRPQTLRRAPPLRPRRQARACARCGAPGKRWRARSTAGTGAGREQNRCRRRHR